MTSIALGDLARNMMLRASNQRLMSEMQTLSETVAQGRVSDLAEHLKGDFRPLAAIEGRMATLSAFEQVMAEASAFLGAQQSAVTQLGENATALSETLLFSDASSGSNTEAVLAQEARNVFTQTVGALNGSAGGRSLFSGANVRAAPLPPADEMLEQLTLEFGAIADPHQRAAAIKDWFTADGAGYAQAYSGNDDQLVGYALSSGDRITATFTAMDPDIRDFLAQTATAALVPEVEVLESIGADLAASAQAFAEKSGLIGLSESRLEAMSVRDAAERSSLEIQLTDMTVPDLYEVAVRLEENQQALERMYLVTSKLSSMSLADYL